MPNRNERITELPLRSRETFDADGEVAARQTVLCASRRVAVDVDTCMECGYCARPPADGEHTLACLHPAARPRPAALRPVRAAEAAPTGPLYGGSGSAVAGVRLPSPCELTAIHQVMTRDVVCVRADVSVDSLAALLLERNISAVPVVNAAGRPIGVASKTDLVRWYREEAGFAVAADPAEALPEPGLSTREVKSTTVADVMMPLAFTMVEDAPLAYAAALMSVEGIHHLPIVAGTGEVVGIVSALDLVRWMARQEGLVITPEGA